MTDEELKIRAQNEIFVLEFLAEKYGYSLVRIHPDLGWGEGDD